VGHLLHQGVILSTSRLSVKWLVFRPLSCPLHGTAGIGFSQDLDPVALIASGHGLVNQAKIMNNAASSIQPINN
jgi:hypothetical protein